MNLKNFKSDIVDLVKLDIYQKFFGTSKSVISATLGNVVYDNLKKRYKAEDFVVKRDGNDSQRYCQVLYNWLQSHDPDYNKRTINQSTKLLTDQIYITNIDLNTFAIVRTGAFAYGSNIYSKYGNQRYEESDSINISIFIFGKHAPKYIKELKNKISELGLSNDKLYTYNVSGNSNKDKNNTEELNSIVSNMNCRDIDTLFYNAGIKEGIIEHIDAFIENEPIYSKRNLLHKTGILLYGNPGTGKTSLATALATKYQYDLIIIDMNTFDTLDVSTLTNCINCDTKNFVVLLEDIDTMYNLDRASDGTQVAADKSDKKVINKMLQFLDSATSPNDVIFIATSNYPDRLDEAILRAGRFDYKVNVGPITEDIAHIMCQSFEVPEKAIKNIIESSKDKNGLCNQSKLQSHILEYFKKIMRGDEYIEQYEDEEDSNDTIKVPKKRGRKKKEESING